MSFQRSAWKTITLGDRAMMPCLPPGSGLECEEAEPEDGDLIVIVPRSTAQELLRVYLRQADGTILLKALNRECNSYSTTDAELKRIGVVHAVRRITLPGAEKQVKNESKEPERRTETSVGPEGYLTFEEAQMKLKLKRTRMYALLQSGELKAAKVGKLWRIREEAISEYFAAQEKKRE